MDTNARWLALYVGKSGEPRAAMITPKEAGDLPFGVNEFDLGLDDFDGEPVTLIQMPADTAFRPAIVDVNDDCELPIQFIDL